MPVFLCISYRGGMSEEPVTPSSQQVAADLTTVAGLLTRRLRTTSPDSRLTPTQRSVLWRLYAEGATTTAELARAEYVRPQSMRLTLGALEEQGLVERMPDPADGRKSVVSVTEAGRVTLAEARAAKENWLSQVIGAELDDAERTALAEAVVMLRRLVER